MRRKCLKENIKRDYQLLLREVEAVTLANPSLKISVSNVNAESVLPNSFSFRYVILIRLYILIN